MKKLFILILMLGGTLPGISQTLTLKECVEKAINNHPD